MAAFPVAKCLWQPAIVTLCLLSLQAAAMSAIRLPAILGLGMVLQRDSDLCIWGWADPGETVTVKLAGQQGQAVTGPDGQWTVTLLPLPAGGPHELLVQGSGEPLVLTDVLVGEVWVCSGQSNMYWPVKLSREGQAEAAAADWPRIRLFTVPVNPQPQALQDVEGHWSACTPASAAEFSAAAYFFGRYLHQQLGVPIGLIHTSVGGTRIEAWTSRKMLESDPANASVLQEHDRKAAQHDDQEARRQYEESLRRWEQKAQRAKELGMSEPAKPAQPADPSRDPNAPAALYNGMIAPLTPLAIRGAIWYQGESNATNAWQYRSLFPAMIGDWRDRWGRDDFPFLFVQLANFQSPSSYSPTDTWPVVRESQLVTLDVAATAMAVAIDIGDAKDIHPTNKQDVGKRLALAALGTVYGRDIPYSGPIYRSMRQAGDAIELSFDHVYDGLFTPDSQPLAGFVIAGEDRQFVDAQARIEGRGVIVSSPKVAKPVAVRYGWTDNPPCNLYNSAHLPASPFRTDDWHVATQPD